MTARIIRRATLLAAIRHYFHSEQVIEVVTPLLRDAGSSEVHLDNVAVPALGYLQTSPEAAMKSLVAETGQSIYQICAAFRAGEMGDRHQLQFQMLEWYRVGFSLSSLMDDLERLLASIRTYCSSADWDIELPNGRIPRISYDSLFQSTFEFSAHDADISQLQEAAAAARLSHLTGVSRRADLLDGLFSSRIEPSLGASIVFDFPACQAAMAELKNDAEGRQVADRFELYLGGLEIANAYQELRDRDQLSARMAENNQQRQTLGKARMPDDADLLEATAALPFCAGAALGIDRLLMVMCGAETITAV